MHRSLPVRQVIYAGRITQGGVSIPTQPSLQDRSYAHRVYMAQGGGLFVYIYHGRRSLTQHLSRHALQHLRRPTPPRKTHTAHTIHLSHSEGCLYLLCICSVSALRHLRRLPVIPGSGRRMGQRWPQRRAPHQQPPPVASRPRRLPQACLRETPYRLPRFGSYSYVILARG